MNVTPSISPDGSRVVFLSEKSLFSIDMYVADVATGRIMRSWSRRQAIRISTAFSSLPRRVTGRRTIAASCLRRSVPANPC
jgi:Tol biopolymer transport system component